jgi:hypothetical protein
MIVLCPNCLDTPVAGHPENACILYVLTDVLRSRGTLTEEQIQALHRDADPNQVWDDIGPIIDRLEDGHYNAKDD